MEGFKGMIAAYLVQQGAPPEVAEGIAAGAVEVGGDVGELVSALIERAHAQTFLAYVQAGTTLRALAEEAPTEGYDKLGMQVLDVARAMFEDALEDGGEEDGEKVGGEAKPDAPAASSLDADLLS